MNLFDRIMAQLEEEVPGGRGTLQAGLVKLCDYVDKLEAKIERLEKNAADQEGYDADVDSWREETDAQLAWRDAEGDPHADERHEDDPQAKPSYLAIDGRRRSWATGELVHSDEAQKVLIEKLRTGIYDACVKARRDGLIPWSDYVLTGAIQAVEIRGTISADPPVAPNQVFSCSRCNTPNEYQDGPFTCHGCK